MPTSEFLAARSNPKELMQRPNPGFTAPETSATTGCAQTLCRNLMKSFSRWVAFTFALLLTTPLSATRILHSSFFQPCSLLLVTLGILAQVQSGWGQTYYNMSSADYSQPFTAISATWPVNWNSVPDTTGTIPSATKTTTTSTTPATIASSTGVGQDATTSTKLVFLTTGTTDNSAAVACDLNLNFSGRNAGAFSFEAAVIFNSTGNRVSTLKVYYSTDGSTWTEITGTSLPFVAVNNVANSASISVRLPSGLNNSSTVKLRFYSYNGSGGSSGSRPKISIDTVAVTSTASVVVPTLTLPTSASVTDTTATLGATVTVNGGASLTSRGTVYGTSAAPTGNAVAEGDTSVALFTQARSGFSPDTAYFYRGYAINSAGTGYSPDGIFRTVAATPTAPTVANATVSTLDVTIGSSDGNPATTTYAIQVNAGSYVQTDGTLSGAAAYQTASAWGTKTVTGLSASTSYSFAVQAKNGADTTTGFGTATALSTTSASCTPPSIGTEPSAATACSGTAPTFTVAATGTTLTYRWRKNGANLTDGATGNGSTYSGVTTATLSINNVQTGDAVAAGSGFDCIVTENNNGPCTATTAPKVALTVNTIPAAPTGTTAQSFCSGSSPTVADLVASGTTVQWYAASSSGSPLSTSTALVTGTHYFASQMVSGCESSARFDVTATMNPTPSAPAGTAAQTFCSGNSPTVASLTVTGTGLKWYAAASGGSALASSTALVNETHYFASQTVSGCEGPARFEITAAVNTTPPTPTGSAAQTFCSENNPTTANLAAAGTGIQWYAAASSGSPLASATALVNGTHYYATSTANGCESSTRFDVTASVHTFGMPGATATIFAENMGTPSAITAIVNYSAGTAPATFQNKGTLTYADGAQTSPADVRNSTPSSTYSGASGNGNIWFTTTLGPYGFSIESINAADYTSLTLNFGYHKESASVHATSSVDYWDGTAWQTVANTAAALFDETATAAAGWYAAKPLALPAGAQISDLKIRFVKSGTTAIRIDDVKLTGQTFTTSVSITPGSSTTFCPGGSVLLTATAGGTHYHWHQDGSPVGTDSATYSATASGNYTVTITDANSCSATSLATTVTVNALPGGGADAFSTGANTAVDLTSAKLKLNDTGSGLQITAVTAGPGLDHGSVALSPIPDGTVTYTPKAGYSGNDTFTYTLRNASGCTVEVTVTATIGSGTSQGANAVFAGTDGPDFVAYFAGIPTAVYTAEHATSATGPWAKLGDNITAPITNPTGYGIGVFEVREARVSGGGGFYRTVYPAY